MASQWFFVQGGKKCGPVSSAQLKALADAGLLQPTEMVLREGAGKWVQAATVNGLFQLPVATILQDDNPFATVNTYENASAPVRRPKASPGWSSDRSMHFVLGGAVALALILGVAFVANHVMKVREQSRLASVEIEAEARKMEIDAEFQRQRRNSPAKTSPQVKIDQPVIADHPPVRDNPPVKVDPKPDLREFPLGPQASLASLEKFPEDYVGKRYIYTVWLDPEGFSKPRSAGGKWIVDFRDGTVKPDASEIYGSPGTLASDKLNYVIPGDQAKIIINDLKANVFTRCEMEFAIQKEGGYYVATILSVKKVNR
jgi:hypothetical protein